MVDKIRQFWQFLIAVSPSITDPEERRYSRLLSILLLSILVVLLVTMPALYSYLDIQRDTRALTRLMAVGIAIIGYLLNRSGFYRHTVVILNLMGTAVIALLAAGSGGEGAMMSFSYFVIAVICNSIFLPLRLTISLSVMQMLVVFLSPLYIADLNFSNVILGPLTFNLLMNSTTILLIYHYRRTEKNLRAEAEAARQAALTNEGRLRLVIDNSPAIIYMMDKQGRFTLSEGKGLESLGLTPGQVVGQSALEMYASYPEVINAIRAVLEKGERAIGQTMVEGSLFNIVMEPLLDARGEVSGLIGLAVDVTERQRVEQARMELMLQRERTETMARFMRNVSHDVRTPLAIIGTSAYLISRKLGEAETAKIKGNLDTINLQIIHLERQLQNMSEIAQFGEASDKYRFEPVHVASLLETLMEEQRILARQKNHHFELLVKEDEDDPLIVRADAEELSSAVRHLMVNAIHYTPEGGEILVTARAENGEIIIEVKDDGIGIAQEEQAHIFEPLYRSDKARNLDNGGMGLGLPLAQMIVESHGGRITVESAAGAGSAFRIYLPRFVKPERAPRETTPETAG